MTEGEKMDFSTIDNMIKGKVREAGLPVHMDSEYCKQWRANHPNCRGCESAEGCNMVVKVAQKIAMAAMIFVAAKGE